MKMSDENFRVVRDKYLPKWAVQIKTGGSPKWVTVALFDSKAEADKAARTRHANRMVRQSCKHLIERS